MHRAHTCPRGQEKRSQWSAGEVGDLQAGGVQQGAEQDRGEQEEEGGGHWNFLCKSRGGGVVTCRALTNNEDKREIE